LHLAVSFPRYQIGKQYYNEKHRSLLVTSNEIGMEGNSQKTKCMFISHQQNAGQIYNIKDS
jgi:hypothetical protein